MQAGQVIVPTEAVRDEGTSFHYLRASRTVEADSAGVAAARLLLTERSVPFAAGKIWTTDAIYRETRQKVDRGTERDAWRWKWKRPPSSP